MHRRIAIKNHVEEIHLITQRCISMLALMVILVALLILRLIYLQLANHDLYTTLSKKNSLDLVPIEPTRGLIYDRNGILLAENIPVFSLEVVPYKIDNIPRMLAEIGKIVTLSDDDIGQFQHELKQHRRFDEVTLKLRLSEQEVARFSEVQYHFPGISIKAHLLRHYPFNGALSHVLGYIARINLDELKDIDAINYSASNYIGKLGVEKYYEDELHGTVGYEQAENDASGEPVRILSRIKPIPGKNLYLTIDVKLQQAVETALAGHRGAVVAIQPSTGQILAMVSEPSYDPNAFVAGINNKDFQALQQSPDRPLYNRAIRGLYPPGSTIKPYIAITGLDSGVTDEHFTLFDPGWYKLPNSSHPFHDWRQHGHGTVNITKAIITSCDVYFYDLSHKIGIQRIDNMLDQFGFGDLTGIDMEEELQGVVSSPAWKQRVKGLPWYPADTIMTGIGQDYMQITPLQLAAAVATIANRGERFTPHLVFFEQEPGKKPQATPTLKEDRIKLRDENIWNIIIDAMQGVLASREGTGQMHFGKLGPYTAAGKTGTAQVHSIKIYDYTRAIDHEDQSVLPEKWRDNSLFEAFAPVENPQIAIAVIVENELEAGGIARKILDYYLLGTPVTPLSPDKGENNTDVDH